MSEITNPATGPSVDPGAWRDRADAGDPEAQRSLGRAYLAQGNVGRARRWLQRAVEAGDGDAASDLGRMHLEGDGVPASVTDALRWFRRGAESGSPHAAYHLATQLFLGLGAPAEPDAARKWLLAAARGDSVEALRVLGLVYARLTPAAEWEPRAFACLMRAASLGDGVAAHACASRLRQGRGTETDAGLADEWLARAAARDVYLARRQHGDADPTEPDDEPAAPEAPVVDFEWPEPRAAEATRHADDPPVYEIGDLVDPEMCDYLINRAAPFLEPARTVDPRTGQPVRNELRTNSSMAFTGARMDIAIHLVENDMTHLARAPVGAAERMALLRYGVGEEYKPHFDYINPHSRDAQHQFQARGQRIKTIFAYLNDVEGGGETEFPRLGVKIEPRRGGGVLFRNVDLDGKPDSASLHAGCPVTGGEKWLATLWIRERIAEHR